MHGDRGYLTRRTALKTGTAGILGAIGLSATQVSAQESDQNFGAGRTLTTSRGPNYGGGEDYVEEHDAGFTSDDANFVVESADELETALEAAEYGDVVFVPRDAEIDTGLRTNTSRGPPGYHVPEGVTLASDRGVDGSPGGLIYTDSSSDDWPQENWPMAVHSDARVTGLRIRGKYWDAEEIVGTRYGVGLHIWDGDWNAEPGTTTNVEIDNCEFSGWSSSCVSQYTGATDCRVHHCDFHDTLIDGLGYGVSVNAGHCEIDHNTFNRNRHAVACSGSSGTSYEAHRNVVGDYTIGHVFDVHQPGGDRFDIHHNTVRASHYPSGNPAPNVTIRDVPDDLAWIHNNWFYNPKEPRETPDMWTDEAIRQVFVDEWTNVEWERNHYGSETEPDPGVGAPHSEKVRW
ncbi:hypothetical protein [Halomontanus rarus]|uniref:hypothetical protein n=1 Tax=Halomontanus rarus TaxID=3034020 RepID=UPI0023E79C67|nr:hypothetical protein [Halovivax sp. TS33]